MKKILICLCAVLLSGCFITNTPGFYSGYKKLDIEEKKNIKFLSEGEYICNLKNDKIIYSINAKQLLDCLNQNDSSIVYLWSPNCSSKICIPLSVAQAYCDENNYQLFLITEYYDLGKSIPQNIISNPMFSVNHFFYKTDYCNKYLNLFTKELIKGKSLRKEESYNRYLVFYKDEFIKTKRNLIEN